MNKTVPTQVVKGVTGSDTAYISNIWNISAGRINMYVIHEDGYVYVNSGNVYDFTLNELQNYESYLKTSAGYKGKVTLYAKISCKYIYYGTEKEAQSIAQINICQRQLFDLD